MDVFDSPVNLAHQQGRKADKLMESAKFDQAAECHQKAAQLLAEAAATEPAGLVRESLDLQHKQHLQQVKVVRSKQQQYQARQVQLKTENGVAVAVAEKCPPQTNLETLENTTEKAGADKLDGPCGTRMRVHRTMQECDSLLQFLNDRSGMSIGARYKAPGARNDAPTMVQSATKAPKSEKQIIEELEIHNEYLRKHLENLLDENQLQKAEVTRLQAENQQLRTKNRELQNQVTSLELSESTEEFGPMPKGMTLDDLPGMELPPLEMPSFDFQDPFRMQHHENM